MQCRCKNCGTIINIRPFWPSSNRCPEYSTKIDLVDKQFWLELLAGVLCLTLAWGGFVVSVWAFQSISGEPHGGIFFGILSAMLLSICLIWGSKLMIDRTHEASKSVARKMIKDLPWSTTLLIHWILFIALLALPSIMIVDVWDKVGYAEAVSMVVFVGLWSVMILYPIARLSLKGQRHLYETLQTYEKLDNTSK